MKVVVAHETNSFFGSIINYAKFVHPTITAVVTNLLKENPRIEKIEVTPVVAEIPEGACLTDQEVTVLESGITLITDKRTGTIRARS